MMKNGPAMRPAQSDEQQSTEASADYEAIKAEQLAYVVTLGGSFSILQERFHHIL